MKIVSLVGARPNFMKIAPFIRAIDAHNAAGRSPFIEHILIHSGQHYDDRMSANFFAALGIPQADINLNIGSGSHAEQVGKTMMALEPVLRKEQPDWVIVVGDVNAVLAGAVTAKKEKIRCAHIEAGLRSRDMAMPEEINRLVADRLADVHFTPDRMANENLASEGAASEGIHFVGNIMIDTLEANREKAVAIRIEDILQSNALDPTQPSTWQPASNDRYALMTLHRPSNVDEAEVLTPIMNFLTEEVCTTMPLIWPIHPRTRKRLEEFGIWEKVSSAPNLILLKPLGYHDMLRLNMGADIMLTDSGGLQEECTVLGTPCLTLRWNTERPITLREHGGASILVGNDLENIRRSFYETLKQERKPERPERWDGKTAERIVAVLSNQAN